MKKLDLGRIITILANVGVIAGIVFLAIELRQNNALLRAEARQVIVQNRAGSLERWADDGEMMQLRLKATNGEQLTTDEAWRLGNDLTALLTRMEYDWEQFENGLVPYIPARAWRGIVTRWPYMRTMWQERRENFSPGFARFVDEEVIGLHDDGG